MEASPAAGSPRGMAIFDHQSKEKAKASLKENVSAATTKSKTTKQSTLLSMKKTAKDDHSAKEKDESNGASQPLPLTQSSKTGFMLWLELNKAQLQQEHPDATEAELNKLAAQKFRALPDDQRQVLHLFYLSNLFIKILIYSLYLLFPVF